MWIALFSRSGSEIVKLCEAIGRKPDLVLTNNFDSSTWYPGVNSLGISVAKHDVIMERLRANPGAKVTLHGYLRILPEDVTELCEIYNGHPGDIINYPELKGKDPQEKAFKLGHKEVGCVIHRVNALVDDGDIVKCDWGIPVDNDLESYYNKLAFAQLELWKDFMSEDKVIEKAVQPSHYKGVAIKVTDPDTGKTFTVDVTTIDVIEKLYEVSKNDGFTDYNRFQSFKYIWRAGNKDDVLQDLKKGRQFLDFAIEALEKKRNESK